ncbi:MAG: phosphate acyltransferase, partial [Cyclobacteriaceae bacterium]
PYIFRGALDVRATAINEEMKLAAVYAIASLAKQAVPEMVLKAYGLKNLKFSRDYLIPKPVDPRLITAISPAVAKAAIDSGVARFDQMDWLKYEEELKERIGIDQRLMSRIISRARRNPKTVVFTEADDLNILKAAQQVLDDSIAQPILLGDEESIRKMIAENELDLGQCQIIDPRREDKKVEEYAKIFFDKRKRKGMTLKLAKDMMGSRNYFGAMMVDQGEADSLISGRSNDYPKTISPSLQVIGVEKGINRVAGMYIVNTRRGPVFFADATVNLNPDVDELVEIIGLTARAVRFFDYEPKIAALSYSNFGSAKGSLPKKVAAAVQIAKEKWPELVIDGDMQANVALNKELLESTYPFSSLSGTTANTLIFPNLASGNIAYKLLMELGGAEAIGPILMGMKKAVHVLQLGSSVREIVNMVAIAVVDAQQVEARESI